MSAREEYRSFELRIGDTKIKEGKEKRENVMQTSDFELEYLQLPSKKQENSVRTSLKINKRVQKCYE